MAEFINTIDVLGDDAVMDGIVNRTIEEFKDDTTTAVGSYAFYGCEELTNVSLPSAETIGGYVFYGCSALQSVYLPKI